MACACPVWCAGRGRQAGIIVNDIISQEDWLPTFLAAFGNSDGDLQMLQYTGAGNGTRFCLYVHHDDAAREYAYDRQDALAKLDKGLDEAAAKAWTVVSMENDWKTVFPAGK